MTYYDTALLSSDTDFVLRVTAAYAIETPSGQGIDPPLWATQHTWDLASQPGFGDAYASARAADNPGPGRDPAVITDEMILSAVQAVVAAESTA